MNTAIISSQEPSTDSAEGSMMITCELEPSLNFRKIDAFADRESLWRFVVRLEMAIQKDLNHRR